MDYIIGFGGKKQLINKMNKNKIIKDATKLAKIKLAGGCPGHDWLHTYRVVEIAKKIAKAENGDPFLVELGALLHDLYDWKFTDPKLAKIKINKWLDKYKLDLVLKEKIAHIVENISFHYDRKNNMKLWEGKIVQDADRLDAIGAIGIARVFSYGGYKKRLIYDPIFKKKISPTSIGHFYEKLLLLKDKMNTKTAKKMAESRHNFMKKYLKQFFSEWEGKQ